MSGRSVRTPSPLPFTLALTFACLLPVLAGGFRNDVELPFDLNKATGLDGANWIWFAGDHDDPAKDAPIGTRYFRRAFALPPGSQLKQARIRITADDAFTLYVNGKEAGRGDDWQHPQTFDLRKYLKPGRNVVAIQATNVVGIQATDPAGLIARIEIRPAKGKAIVLVTDGTWKSAEQVSPGWRTPGFDPRTWQPARVLGAYGCQPWGAIEKPRATR